MRLLAGMIKVVPVITRIIITTQTHNAARHSIPSSRDRMIRPVLDSKVNLQALDIMCPSTSEQLL